jgi:hypothetical protein
LSQTPIPEQEEIDAAAKEEEEIILQMMEQRMMIDSPLPASTPSPLSSIDPSIETCNTVIKSDTLATSMASIGLPRPSSSSKSPVASNDSLFRLDELQLDVTDPAPAIISTPAALVAPLEICEANRTTGLGLIHSNNSTLIPMTIIPVIVPLTSDTIRHLEATELIALIPGVSETSLSEKVMPVCADGSLSVAALIGEEQVVVTAGEEGEVEMGEVAESLSFLELIFLGLKSEIVEERLVSSWNFLSFSLPSLPQSLSRSHLLRVHFIELKLTWSLWNDCMIPQ